MHSARSKHTRHHRSFSLKSTPWFAFYFSPFWSMSNERFFVFMLFFFSTGFAFAFSFILLCLFLVATSSLVGFLSFCFCFMFTQSSGHFTVRERITQQQQRAQNVKSNRVKEIVVSRSTSVAEVRPRTKEDRKTLFGRASAYCCIAYKTHRTDEQILCAVNFVIYLSNFCCGCCHVLVCRHIGFCFECASVACTTLSRF